MNKLYSIIFISLLHFSFPALSFAENSFNSYKKAAISKYDASVDYFKNLFKTDPSKEETEEPPTIDKSNDSGSYFKNLFKTEESANPIIEKIEKRINTDAFNKFTDYSNRYYSEDKFQRVTDFEVIEHNITENGSGYVVDGKAKGYFSRFYFPYSRVYGIHLRYAYDGSYESGELRDPNS